MKRLVSALLGVVLLVAACGDDGSGDSSTTTTTPAASSGVLHLSGGIEGRDETWTIEVDGTVLGPDGYVGLLDAGQRDRLEAAIEAADFFDLNGEYLPSDQCCDRFLYELTVTSGSATHTVITLDGADAPESLFVLIQTFLDVARPEA